MLMSYVERSYVYKELFFWKDARRRDDAKLGNAN